MRIDTDLLRDLLVESAQAELIPRFRRSDSRIKADGTLVTQADLAMQQRILGRLNHHYPEIPLLGEEMPADRQLAILNDDTQGYWCLDPLDGTANFVAGMPFFAVSLAYMSKGRVELGLVYDPIRDELFHARRGSGAWLNQTPLNLDNRLDRLQECVAMVDYKRLPPALACQLASAPPYRSQRSIGSVALDWCWLAAGRLQLYLHGGARLWDYAAGTLIFSEAGGHFSLLDPKTDGNARSEPGLWPQMAVAGANRRLFETWLSWLEGFS